MSEQFTLYLKMDGGEGEADRLAAAIRELESVGDVDAQEEEPVRSGVEIIQEVTLTVTALGGAVGAVNLLVEQIQKLLDKFRVRSAQVEADGELSELPVGGAPRNENPAQ
jgi:hypothetical protein